MTLKSIVRSPDKDKDNRFSKEISEICFRLLFELHGGQNLRFMEMKNDCIKPKSAEMEDEWKKGRGGAREGVRGGRVEEEEVEEQEEAD